MIFVDISQMNKKTTVVGLVIAGLFIILFASSAVAGTRVNDIAPAFSLQDISGKEFSLGDVVGETKKGNGRGVILSFFASWCVPCRSELPLINSHVDEFKKKGITVVIVNLKEDIDTIRALLDELKVDKPIVLSDRHGSAAEKFGVRALPSTYFIGADGRVRLIIFGEIYNEKELRDGAGKLLK